jgi:tetratricopeptide (TPR) repeat protein
MARNKHKSQAARDNPGRGARWKSSGRKPSEQDITTRVPVNDFWPSHWRGRYVLAVLGAIALLASLNSLSNGFTFDDTQQVLANEFIKRLSNLPTVFTTSVWAFDTDNLSVASADSYYRPMFMALFTFNYWLFGTAAWGWHLVNALIHTAATLLVFLTLREATDRRGLSAIAAGLFAVHPSHSESVAWISGITDPLMALFLLPVFYFYLRFRKTRRKRFMAIALALFLPSLLSKETAIVLPAVIAYCEIFHFGEAGPLRKRFIRAASLAAMFLAPAAVYLLMRYIALSRLVMPPGGRFGIQTVLMTAPRALLKYVELMIVPIGYNLQHYIAPVGSVLEAGFLLPVVLIGAIITALVVARSRMLTLGAVWFTAWLLPPLAGLRVFVPEYFVQERYLYLPSIGFCLAVALGIEQIVRRRIFGFSGKAVSAATCASLVTLWTFVYVDQNRVWHDTLTLLRHCALTNPDRTQPHITLATEYYMQGMREEAERENRKALQLDPNCIDAIINLSQFAYNEGRIDLAIEHLKRAESIIPDGPRKRGYLSRIHHDLGFYYSERKSRDLAELHLRRAVEVLPYPKNWFALGNFYFDTGRYQEALEMYELTRSQTSGKYAPLHLKLGRTYDRLGQVEQARDEYNKYLELARDGKDRPEVIRRLSQLESLRKTGL